MKEKINSYKYSLIYILLIIAFVFISLMVFYNDIGFPFIDAKSLHLRSKLYALFDVLCFVVLYISVGKRKYIFFISLLLFQLFIIANLMYYRTYETIASIYVIGQFNNLDGLSGSILNSFRMIDSFLVSIPLLLVILYYSVIKGKRRELNSKYRWYSVLFILAIFFITVIPDIYPKKMPNGAYISKLEVFEADPNEGCVTFSPVIYGGWELKNMFASDKINKEDYKEINDWLKDHNKYTDNMTNSNFNKKNVILIIVESLESWPVNRTVDNIEITPNLNKMLKEGRNVFAPNVLPQTKDGRSSDTQIMVNTGLLPVNKGSIFCRYPLNNYLSIPEILKKDYGYYCATVIGTKPSFWNQGSINPSLGYDTLFSESNLKMDDIEGMGLSDVSIFNQSVKIIDKLKNPFLLEIVTLSSHTPFKLSENKKRIKFGQNIPVELSDYLTSINYTDYAIGSFINELKKRSLYDNSVIIIVGDHEALPKDVRENIDIKKYCRDLDRMNPYVPFIVLNSPYNVQYNDLMGQIDIFPTLKDILGLGNSNWNGLGNDILSKNNSKIVIDKDLRAYLPNNAQKPSELKHFTSAWQISDKIIRADYFRSINKN